MTGLLSFQNPYASSSSHPFDRTFSELPDPIIAPLWADFNSSISTLHRHTDNDTVLERVSEVVSSMNSNYRNYQPTLAIIVTWESFSSTSLKYVG